ncbi:MAG: hypothetical protein QXR68_04240 [Pyrobaculum sp.]
MTRLFFFTLVLMFLFIYAWSQYAAIIKAEVKTGRWSFYVSDVAVRDAEGSGVCSKESVEAKWGDVWVSVIMYGCGKAIVDVSLRPESTVPICIEPKGPVESMQKILLYPGQTVSVSYIFTSNGTLIFSIKEFVKCG